MKSIRSQLMMYPLLAVLLLSLAMGLIAHQQLSRVPDHLMHQYQDIVDSRADTIHSELTHLIEKVEMLSQTNILRSGDEEAIQAFLPTVVLEDRYRNMTVTDTEGLGWTTNGDYIDISEQEQYENIILEGEPFWITEPFISPFADPDVPIMIVSHEIRDDTGELQGLVNLVTEVYFLSRVIESVELGETGVAWLMNNEGEVVIQPDNSFTTSHNAVHLQSENVAFNRLNDGHLEWLEHQNEEGNQVFTFSAKIDEPSTEWNLMFSIDRDEVLGEVEGIQLTITAGFIAAMGLVLLFSWFFSRQMSKPILRLKEVFEEATQGNSDIRADESVNNEIGAAAKSFNAMHDRIRSLTYFDPLTSLYNFNAFLMELPYRIKNLWKLGGHITVALISIDDFKRYNSLRGYHAGNQILVGFAERLQEYLNQEEMIGRYFGDEFIILIRSDSKDHAERRLKILWQNAMNDMSAREDGWQLRMSIGAAFMEDGEDENDIEEIIAHANIAKLQAKRDGGNCYQFYNQGITDSIQEDQKIENALHFAVERGEFMLHYQPIIDISNGRVSGNEALLRWVNPEFSHVPVGKVIDIAERSGLITDIGQWVMEEALRQNKAWQDQGYEPMVISINISVLQFEQARFIRNVREAIHNSGLEPEWVQLEITETTAMSPGEDKVDKMAALKGLGVSIAIDDFGTGYSSLAYFTQFPISTLKIDRTFVSRLPDDPKAEMITNAIISMAESLEISTTAEGVETKEQQEALRELGCTHIQGFYYARPCSAVTVISHFRTIGMN
ncbi:bifunctional diguanylate cyclase/phosphodiesterase [Salisediminibacterium beveridgei]|nr:EAL domain-containing protein [Salisediminibacterium beveridgei]